MSDRQPIMLLLVHYSDRSECTACAKNFLTSSIFHGPCGHHYCGGCLVDLVEVMIRDESLFPLRCCRQNFPMAQVAHFLTSKLLSQFRTKCIEFGTPSATRIYCPNPRCSSFLGSSDNSDREVDCPQCQTAACSACKNAAHPGEACAENAAILQVKALAQAEHWQTCPGCKAIIELSQGCYHMTCTCRTEFCYLCAARWKTCTCPQWEEARLLDTAHQGVVNQFGARAAVVEPRRFQERVGRRVAELRVNHDCVHDIWKFRHGGGTCNRCNDALPTFLMVSLFCG